MSLAITVAYCICRAEPSHQIRGCLLLTASLWHSQALFSWSWELWSPGLCSSFLIFCHHLCSITRLNCAPGCLPLNGIWSLPWEQRQSSAHSCFCCSTVCDDLYASFPPLPGSFSLSHVISAGNHWLMSRDLTLGTQERPVVTSI